MPPPMFDKHVRESTSREAEWASTFESRAEIIASALNTELTTQVCEACHATVKGPAFWVAGHARWYVQYSKHKNNRPTLSNLKLGYS